MKLPAVLALVMAPSMAEAASTLPELRGLPELTVAQSDYVEHCSGCHGMQGNSAPAEIPVLRDRVGYFMCTQQGREYLIRLPNVAYSAISDNQELADMMNFVVFGLGGNSAPRSYGGGGGNSAPRGNSGGGGGGHQSGGGGHRGNRGR